MTKTVQCINSTLPGSVGDVVQYTQQYVKGTVVVLIYTVKETSAPTALMERTTKKVVVTVVLLVNKQLASMMALTHKVIFLLVLM